MWKILSQPRARMLFTYLRPQRMRVSLLGLLLLGSITLQLYNPQVLKHFIDSTTKSGSQQTLATAVLFLAIALVQQILSIVSVYLSENIGWGATNALRADLLLHCLRLDPAFHKSRTPGELIDRIDGDVTTLANFFSQFVIQIAGNLLLLIGILVILWSVDGRIGLLMLITSLLVLFALYRIQAVVVPYWKIARQKSAELYGFIEERLLGTEDIRSSGAQPYTMRRLYEIMGAYFRTGRSARLRGRFVWTTSDNLFTLGTAAAYLLAAQLFRSHTLTIGTVYSLFFYIGLLFRPLTQLTQQAEDFQKAGAGMARIQELLDTRSALEDTGNTPLPDGPLSVEFRSVCFGYDAEAEPVLRDVAFQIHPGEVLGLLGRTGSGKTTLTRLLFRLFDPQSGVLALGGVNVKETPLKELRRRVAIVTQEVQLFHATVRDNLTLFDDTIPDARILEAIETLELGPWLAALPDGLDTVLGGSGSLSAGEAQLLAFTRVFLRDPGLVILDEASSRLDPVTEQLIERAVDRLLENRTGIVIAHRLHTVHRADKILILEGGRVLEAGERETLRRDPESRFAQLLRVGMEEVLV
jgi:ATP-binding cassette, subfamily B, bacterial